MIAFLLETLAAWWLPIFTISVVLGVQWMFWIMATVTSTDPPALLPTDSNDMVAVASPKLDDKEKNKMHINAKGASSSTKDPSSLSNQTSAADEPSTTESQNGKGNYGVPSSTNKNSSNNNGDENKDDDAEDLFQMNDQWRCACEGGFLPPGMLKSFGAAEAVMRLGTGQCYHKQT